MPRDAAAPPSPRAMDRMVRALRPVRWLTSPAVSGLENVPATRPLLFVGNHTLFGVLDAPMLIAEVYRLTGIALRSLGDDLHFKVPLWAAMTRRIGAVPASPEACARLMREGEAILVFPGGAREVSKRKGEKYELVWGNRVGFARMAIEHACTIVPFACVGVEDAFDIVIDADEILASPVGRVLERLGVRPDLVWPVVKGIGPTPLPRPERLYFGFAPPIETASYERRSGDPERCAELRDRVRAAVRRTIRELRAQREADPDRSLLGRLARRAGLRRDAWHSR